MRLRHLLLGAGLALAAALAVFGDKNPPSEVVEPVVRQVTPPAPARTANRNPASSPVVDAIQRLLPRDQLGTHGDEKFGAGGDDAFATRNWMPPPPPPPPQVAPPPPPPPTAPPLPFTVIGKAEQEGAWMVYLARGEQTYVVREKDVVQASYRVESIKPPVMTLTYLPLNQVQQINIGVFD